MFEAENELEKSMIKAVKYPDDRPRFYQDLLEAYIYALSAGQAAPEISNETLQKGTSVHFDHFEIQGSRYLPIFTSLKRLQTVVKSQQSYMKLKGRDFFEMTRGERVFLNPGSEVAKGFTPREISDLLDGSIFKPQERYQVDQDTTILVGQPTDFPAQLVKDLSELFSKDALVRAAYLALVASPTPGGKSHYIIGIDIEGDWARVLADVKRVASQGDAAKAGVDFIPIGETAISRYMTMQTEAFYQRDPDFVGGAGF